jgi:peptidoglycan/xylan/chitin deacetylase (PgdA/CDA1 family)
LSISSKDQMLFEQEGLRFSFFVILTLLSLMAVLFAGCMPTEHTKKTSTMHQQSRRFDWPDGKAAAVSLSFDDGYANQVDIGVPLLDKYNVKATFYVLPDKAEKRLGLWRKAAKNGHEIGCHTIFHPCTGNYIWSRRNPLEDYTLERMAEELDDNIRIIERLSRVKPVTFAYPCGQKFVGRGRNVKSYVPLVAERFKVGRSWLDEGMNDPYYCDMAQVLAIELDYLDFKQAKELIDKAVENGSWLVFAGHNIGKGGSKTTRIDTIEAICRYANKPRSKIWLDTVAVVGAYISEKRDAANYSCVKR